MVGQQGTYATTPSTFSVGSPQQLRYLGTAQGTSMKSCGAGKNKGETKDALHRWRNFTRRPLTLAFKIWGTSSPGRMSGWGMATSRFAWIGLLQIQNSDSFSP
ncbi:hypothetical protein ACS0TY_005939 [Phlomoides rotata]